MNMFDAVLKTLGQLREDPRAQLAALETRLAAAEAESKRLDDADAEALRMASRAPGSPEGSGRSRCRASPCHHRGGGARAAVGDS